MSEYVFLNDRLVDTNEASISVHDVGLLHGVGLFETMRSYGGKVFRLDDHLDRLFGSAQALGIEVSQERNEIAGWIEVLIEANDLAEGRLRLTLTRGSIRLTEDDEPAKSTLLVTGAAMPGYPEQFYENGMTAIVSRYRQDPYSPTAGHKTINYFSRLLALQEAQQQQAGEALWFTPGGKLAEGCISNVFLVRQGKLLTPPVDTPVLGGVTRRVVLELADEHGIDCAQCELAAKDLAGADEIILTNSIMELMPVCRIERQAVGQDKPGPVYKRLHELYREAVAEQCS